MITLLELPSTNMRYILTASAISTGITAVAEALAIDATTMIVAVAQASA